MKFRLLNANEIDCRISTVRSNGLTLLLYKDARVDQNLLDETVGSMNWQRSHQIIGENLYCTVSIWDAEKNCWVSKQDVGIESYTEKEKGQASDSFKRACFNFGIGRELYTAPFIWIPSSACEIVNKDGTYKCFDKFEVSKIGYDEERNINELVIINSKSRVEVYRMGSKPTETFSGEEKINATKIKALKKSFEDANIPIEFGLELYGVKDFKELTEMQYVNMVQNWEKLKAKYNERTTN